MDYKAHAIAVYLNDKKGHPSQLLNFGLFTLTTVYFSQGLNKVTQHWIDNTPPTYMVWRNWYSKQSFKVEAYNSIELGLDGSPHFNQPNTGRVVQ